MDRRGFLRASLAAGACALPLDAAAWMFCGPFTINGAHYCYAGIRSPLRHVPAAAVDGRNRVRWCWAACAEMLFRYQGVALDQSRIVTAAWGSIAAVPTAAEAVAAGLERDWVDADGRTRRARARLLPVDLLAAARVLERDTPPILVTRANPVLLTRLRYAAMRGDQGRIQTANVLDPWPGRDHRYLSQAEWGASAALLDLVID